MNKKSNSYLNIKEICILILLLFCAFSLLINRSFSNSVLGGLALFYTAIIPSLFPYFIITAIFSKLNLINKIADKLSPLSTKLFCVGGNTFFAFILSVLSGYPIGAKMVADLRNNNLISQKEAIRGSYLCSTSSPMFLISTVGGIMFNNVKFGVLLFISHISSVIILSFIFSFIKRDKVFTAISTTTSKSDNIFYEAVYNSVLSILTVGGIITVFYLLTDILAYYKILSPLTIIIEKIFNDKNVAKGITFGIFECTKGLKFIASSNVTLFTLPICAFLTTFSGLSILMQCICHLKSAKIKIAPFIFCKITCAILSFIIGLILSTVFLI